MEIQILHLHNYMCINGTGKNDATVEPIDPPEEEKANADQVGYRK